MKGESTIMGYRAPFDRGFKPLNIYNMFLLRLGEAIVPVSQDSDVSTTKEMNTDTFMPAVKTSSTL